MADILVTSPFQPFTLPTQFKAVFNGYIYCGTVGAVDPSVSQVQVYLVNEAGDKVPVAQPLRTNSGGFLVYNGQPAKFVTDSNHSLLAQDSFHVQVWYASDMAKIDPDTAFQELAAQVTAKFSEITGRYGYVGKSLYDVLTESERIRVLSDDSTLDLTAKIQALIDEQRPFYLVPNVRNYCHGFLQMKSGAKILGAGMGTNQVPMTAGIVETSIVFNQATTTVGIKLSSASGWVTDWAIDGVTLTTLDNQSAITSALAFTMLDTNSAHNGCYNFKLHAYISGARLGVNAICNLWNGDLDLRVAYCYRAFYKGPTGFTTSLDGWIKCSFCFHGVTLQKATYSNVSMWYDQCGKSAPAWVGSSAPADVLPVLFTAIESVNISGTIGVEKSNAQWMNVSAFSSINYRYFLFCDPAQAFYKDPARTNNVALANQSCIFNSSSQIVLTSAIITQTVAIGFPAASITDPTYFYASNGSGSPRLALDGCYLDLENYCVCPAGTETTIDASPARNGRFNFGATNINTPNNNRLGQLASVLQVGTDTKQAYHQIVRNAAFVEGDIAMFVTGATGASSVQFKAVNGAGGNAAPCAMRVPTATSNSRSINAGGTVNVSGADYAEYMIKVDGCGDIAKGDICGVTVDGLLTDKFDDSISFVVKSTDPSFVGGDTWFTHDEPVHPGYEADKDEISAYEAATIAHFEELEEARKKVDRIAFSGRVPCNVIGAAPGDYIIPTRDGDGGIRGVAVTGPTLEQYRISIGQAWGVLPDGMALVAVKIC